MMPRDTDEEVRPLEEAFERARMTEQKDKCPELKHKHQWIPGGIYTHTHKRGNIPHGHHGSKDGPTCNGTGETIDIPKIMKEVVKQVENLTLEELIPFRNFLLENIND